MGGGKAEEDSDEVIAIEEEVSEDIEIIDTTRQSS